MTLEQLAVVSAPQITFDNKVPERVTVEFTPTVPHCGMSTFIGLFLVLSIVCLFNGAPKAYRYAYGSCVVYHLGTKSVYESSQDLTRANKLVCHILTKTLSD